MLIVLSDVRSHVHSHVELIYVLLVHTFNEDRANLSSGDLQQALMKLVSFRLMSYGRLCFSYVSVCVEPATGLSPNPPHSNAQGKRRKIERLTWGLTPPISMSSKFDKPVPADLMVKVSGVSINRVVSHFLRVVQSAVTDCQNLVT